jgi:hypothetical protein
VHAAVAANGPPTNALICAQQKAAVKRLFCICSEHSVVFVFLVFLVFFIVVVATITPAATGVVIG